MLRQLLAILALVSGLVATQAPAHARIAGLEAVRVEASSTTAQNCATQVHAARQKALPRSGSAKGTRAVAVRPSVVVAVPTVFFGADRAFE